MKLSLLLILLSANVVFAQDANAQWMIKPFSDLGFAENLNLYDDVMDEEILFYAEYAPYKIFLSNDAFVFGRPEEFTEEENHERREKLEHGQPIAPVEWSYFKVEFQNINSGLSVEPQKIKQHTRNFHKPDNANITYKAKTFDELIYKNLYPNIDLLIELPAEGGLKYSFIVHPGGDYTTIEMEYFNAEVHLDDSNNLILANEKSEFSDIAPVSTIGDLEIESSFLLVGNKVRFEVGEYDPSETLIIDPWLVTDLPAEFDEYLRAYEIGYDNAGNCMVLGDAGKTIALYDNAGVLQWVWEYLAAISCLGDIATSPVTGDTYFSTSLAGPTERIDVTGVTTAINTFTWGEEPAEKWRLKFNEAENELILGNGGTSGDDAVTKMGADLVSEVHFQGVPAPFGEIRDISSLDIDPDGSAIYLSVPEEVYYGGDSPYDNMLFKLDYSDPNTVIWDVPTGFAFLEVGSIPYGPALGFMPNGFNGITCGTEFLYTYNGKTIRRYDKMTGDLIDTHVFVEELMYEQGGMDIDLCDNLYVGTADEIVIFDSELNEIGSYPIPSNSYDLVVGNGKVYCCGDGFVAEFDALGIGGLTVGLSATAAICEACNGTATVFLGSCEGPEIVPESVIWSPSGSTDITATDLCEGWHVATVTWINEEGETFVEVDSVEITIIETEITVDQETTDEVCPGACNGMATFNPTAGEGPYSYNLDGETNGTGEFSDLCAGTYDITITDANGCEYTGSITIGSGEGLEIVIATLNEPTCYGFTDGSVTVEVVGGLGGVTYEWIPENIVAGGTYNNAGAGTYIVYATAGGDCSDSLVIVIDQPDPLAADLSITNPLCFGDSTGNVVVTDVYNAQGDLTNISYFWAPNYFGEEGVGIDSAYQMPAGTYTVTINDDFGCSEVIDFTITQPTELVFSEFGMEPAYCRLHEYQSGNGVVYAAATGGTPDYDYQWKNLVTGLTFNNTTWGGRNPGLFEMTVTDNNGCQLIKTIKLDSVSPIAAFTVLSDQLNTDLEGTELVIAQFVNESEYFANPHHPDADTTFFWNLNHPNSDWIISHDYNQIMDTTYVGEAIYEVCLVAINKNGCTDTACKNIIVHVQPKFIAPNIFSPGDNGINDLFTFEFVTEGIETFHCQIINRWGVVVGELNDITASWDGTDRSGDNCPTGVYFYTYEAVSTNGTVFNGQGNVQLVRRE